MLPGSTLQPLPRLAVRPAERRDADRIIALARAMHAESPLGARIPFEPPRVREVLDQILADPTRRAGFVLSARGPAVGFIAGYLSPYTFSFQRYVGDMGFYVDPRYRPTRGPKLLIETLATWGKEHGACEIALGLQTEKAADRIGRYYERLGFRFIGGLYKRDIA